MADIRSTLESDTNKCQPNQKGGGNNGRYTYLTTLFGKQTGDRIKSSKVLVVGAGGIGCELLKNLVCTGFGHITIVDLDTVDTSNLNRQFLFQKRHVKRPKSLVAKETASTFNPDVKIQASQSNIMDPEFDQNYFKQFDLVMNALDNLQARRHVNKMCIATKIPLIESGTAGYTGQVQPILKGKMECYDCQPKPLPKTFPVCTIRSTPSSSIHCIVWAKSYLFPQLFGPEDENEGADLDEAIQNGESAKEVENLKAEVKRMKQIRSQLNSPEMSKIIFEKIFQEDIERLLMMKDMWKYRKAPNVLIYEELLKETHDLENGNRSIDKIKSGLKDQQVMNLVDSFKLFCSSLLALGKRIESDPQKEPLTWDKDDDDALNFVTAASNLRATVFGIPQKSRFEVKEMAGNIIPAIATTNSAVSALIVFQAINILMQNDLNSIDDYQKIDSRRPWYSKNPERIILPGSLDLPNLECEVCQSIYSKTKVKSTISLKEFIGMVLKDGKLFKEEEVDEEDDENLITIQEGNRLIFDPDFEENLNKTFQELKLIDLNEEKILRITDENEKFVAILITISKIEPTEKEGKLVIIDEIPTKIPKRYKPIKAIEKQEKEDNNTSDIELNQSKIKKNQTDENQKNLKKRRDRIDDQNGKKEDDDYRIDDKRSKRIKLDDQIECGLKPIILD